MSTSRPHRLRGWALHMVGPMILLVLLFRVDLTRTLELLQQVDPWYLAAAFASNLPIIAIRAHRWVLFLPAIQAKPPFSDLVSIYAASIFVGAATPGRVGEFIKVFYLKRLGMSMGSALVSVIIERGLDVLFLLALGYVSLAVLLGVTSASVHLGAALLGAVGLIGVCALQRSTLRESAVDLLVRILPQRITGYLEENWRAFREAFRQVRTDEYAIAALETVAAWCLHYLAFYLAALALGLHVSYLYMVWLSTVCALLALVPITVAGLGTRDATLILLMGREGFTEPQALALSFVILILVLAFAISASVGLVTKAGREALRVTG